MGMKAFLLKLCCLLVLRCVSASEYSILLESTDITVLGAEVQFNVSLLKGRQLAPPDTYRYIWRDNGQPQHYQELESHNPYSNWSVVYPRHIYSSGTYTCTVTVQKLYSFLHYWYDIANGTSTFLLTNFLNGKLNLIQNGTERPTEYVSSFLPLNQTVKLTQADQNYLIKNLTGIKTYWFLNCVYFGQTNGFTYIEEYCEENEEFFIEALVVADCNDTQIKTSLASQRDLISTGHRQENSSLTFRDKFDTFFGGLTKTSKHNPTSITTKPKITELSLQMRDKYTSTSFTCLNQSVVATDPKKIYGYFNRKVIVKVPAHNLTLKGKNWLQPGELLELTANCMGSSPFEYCIKIFRGPQNITGNETCLAWQTSNFCTITFKHYFQTTNMHTVLFLVKNSVAKVVSQVAINFYEAKRQSEISVIVVPVFFSLIATILVVFGIAYYIQNKSRYMIEVADFNFGETQSMETEYKTFQQRLLVSIKDAINLHHTDQHLDNQSNRGNSSKYEYMS